MKFDDLGFEPQLQEGLEMMGFNTPTPIQEKAIPVILKNRDLIACAQTGTGKTAAFVLPILNKLCKGKSSKINTIIVSPTRELAMQIDRQIEGFSYFTNSSSFPIYGGGTGSDFDAQKKAIKNGSDILVCTPGRLLAHM
ncbi:MAG: DEAD/DEAH box helicase, partial [Flavobacteriales bacterium]|nr:DEAD/DEAH box helicase [Flavobacteriales bacterium]